MATFFVSVLFKNEIAFPPYRISHHALLHCHNVISYSRNLCLLPHPFTVHLREETDCLLYSLLLSSRGQQLHSPEHLLSQAGQSQLRQPFLMCLALSTGPGPVCWFLPCTGDPKLNTVLQTEGNHHFPQPAGYARNLQGTSMGPAGGHQLPLNSAMGEPKSSQKSLIVLLSLPAPCLRKSHLRMR